MMQGSVLRLAHRVSARKGVGGLSNSAAKLAAEWPLRPDCLRECLFSEIDELIEKPTS